MVRLIIVLKNRARGIDNCLTRHYNKSKMFIRAKKQGNQTYYYLVKNKREGKRVIQKVIKYLGKEKPSPEALQRIISEVKP